MGLKRSIARLIKNTNTIYTTLLFIFLWLLTLSDNGDYFFAQRAGLMGFLGLALTWFFARRYTLLAGIFFGYCLNSALYVSFWRSSSYLSLGAAKQTVLQRGVLLGTLATLLIWLVVTLEMVPRRILANLFLALGFYVSIHYWFLSGLYAPEGFLMTPTLAALYLVFLIPLAISENKSVCLWFLVPTIFRIHGNTAMAALSGLIIGYFWICLPRFCGAIASGMAFLMPYVVFSGRLDDKGRLEIWRLAYRAIQESPFKLTGFGAGTAYQLVPWLQQDKGLSLGGMYTYLHNEYLQGLFELGYLGLALALALYVSTFVRAYRAGNPHGLAFLCALAPACFGMFPLRHDTLLFLVAFQLHPLLKPRNPC